jgi:uncharacterized protein (DUF433 family)
MGVALLDREVYSEGEAARLLRVAPSTLHYWLEGEGGRGKSHEPVIRPERRGRGASVTWAEFVEAGLLREYRTKQVHMSTLRRFIELLRDEFDVPYPLADRRPWIDKGAGRGLVWDAQVGSGLDAEHALVALASNQYVLTPPSQSFFDRVDWEGDTPMGYRPHDDPASHVRCLPTVRFGRPSVQGISTAIIWEQHSAGLDNDEIAVTYEIDEDEVFWAIAYEHSVGHTAA